MNRIQLSKSIQRANQRSGSSLRKVGRRVKVLGDRSLLLYLLDRLQTGAGYQSSELPNSLAGMVYLLSVDI